MRKNHLISLCLLIALSSVSLFTTGCSDDPASPKDPPANESETITTVKLRLVQTDDTTKVFNAQWRDLDGEGGNAPVITGLTGANALGAGRSYRGSLEVLDETKNPAEDITEEIREEDEEHQLFYISTVTGLTFQYSDSEPRDANSRPLGLVTNVITGVAGSGTLRIILKHEATKNNTIATPSTDGETDFDITLPVTVQ